MARDYIWVIHSWLWFQSRDVSEHQKVTRVSAAETQTFQKFNFFILVSYSSTEIFRVGHTKRRRDKSRLSEEKSTLSACTFCTTKNSLHSTNTKRFQVASLSLSILSHPAYERPLILLPSFRTASRRLNEICQRRDVMNLRPRVYIDHIITQPVHAKYSLRVTGTDGNWAYRCQRK